MKTLTYKSNRAMSNPSENFDLLQLRTKPGLLERQLKLVVISDVISFKKYFIAQRLNDGLDSNYYIFDQISAASFDRTDKIHDLLLRVSKRFSRGSENQHDVLRMTPKIESYVKVLVLEDSAYPENVNCEKFIQLRNSKCFQNVFALEDEYEQVKWFPSGKQIDMNLTFEKISFGLSKFALVVDESNSTYKYSNNNDFSKNNSELKSLTDIKSLGLDSDLQYRDFVDYISSVDIASNPITSEILKEI